MLSFCYSNKKCPYRSSSDANVACKEKVNLSLIIN
jgi:hypothetical protein